MSNPEDPPSLRNRLCDFFGCGSGHWLGCAWNCLLELLWLLWIARAPFGIVVFGYLLLGFAPQAQDLLTPLVDSSPLYLLLFFVLHFVFWAMPVHYSARILFSDDRRLFDYAKAHPSPYLRCVEQYIPRLLGIATFAALVVSAYRANINLPNIKDQGVTDTLSSELHHFMVGCVIAAGVFLAYTVYRHGMGDRLRSTWGSRLIAFARPLLNLLDISCHRSAKVVQTAGNNPEEAGLLLLIFVFIIFVAVLLSAPNVVAEYLPLLFSVSLMLGGWLPILTYLSAIGRRVQAPLIIGAFAGIAVLTSIVGDNHDVRLLEVKATEGSMKLDAALHLWMEANGCTPDKASECPRPIIVAASGGASRAGFFMASVLGELLDKAAANKLDATQMRNRIFAISSISGGSVGAVMAVAAMANGGEATTQPCRSKPVPYWYGTEVKNWRGCLESLMAGDFLTPTFIGLGFHDLIPFGPWQDRAAIIERSWEQHFTETMNTGTPNAGKLSCWNDLACPFYSLRPTKDLWLPLLVLNGVSVDSGNRIVTTPLSPTYEVSVCPSGDAASSCPLFADTLFFHDLIRNPSKGSGWRTELQRLITFGYLRGHDYNDVRLSTAAHNSARFPIVSPPGNIRDAAHYVIDRIVDGGYLENFGVLTASELAQAVHAVSPELAPLVLVISNDPNEPVEIMSAEKAGATSFLTDLSGIVYAVVNTRDARGMLAVDQLKTLSRGITKPQCKVPLVRIRVWPERIDPKSDKCEGNFSETPRAVSMSWWLSSPLQLRLIEEIEGPQTCNAGELKDTWDAISMKSNCLKQ
jgi:hypothetical protein